MGTTSGHRLRPATHGPRRALLPGSTHSGDVGRDVGLSGDDHARIALSKTCRLRQSELLGIRWQDVDLERRVLRFGTQLGRRIPPDALAAFVERLREDASGYEVVA